jgi:hypothetical protein
MKIVANIFIEEYNRANKTQYKWIDEKSYQPGGKTDFCLFDSSNRLDVQLTRATADPVREFIRPGLSGKVVEEVRKYLERDKLPPISVYLNFSNPPKNAKDRDDAIYWLHYYLAQKVSSSIGLTYFSYDNSFDSQFLPQILKWVSDINIWSVSGEKGYARIAYGWDKDQKPEPWPGDDVRIIQAVEKKKGLPEDIILLIDSGWSPISDYYIQPIVDSVSKSKIKEIWVVENFSQRERAYRIK